MCEPFIMHGKKTDPAVWTELELRTALVYVWKYCQNCYSAMNGFCGSYKIISRLPSCDAASVRTKLCMGRLVFLSALHMLRRDRLVEWLILSALSQLVPTWSLICRQIDPISQNVVLFFWYVTIDEGGTRWRSWLRQCAASRKVAGSIPDGVIQIFSLT